MLKLTRWKQNNKTVEKAEHDPSQQIVKEALTDNRQSGGRIIFTNKFRKKYFKRKLLSQTRTVV